MEEMTLSTKECMLAAARLGARNFFGIPDPFFGMTADEVRQEAATLQLSLEKRGYAEAGFDDAFVLKPDVDALIRLCTGCNSYLLAQMLIPGEKEHCLVLYAGESGYACARVRGDTVVLSRMEEADMAGILLPEIRPVAEGTQETGSITVKQSTLAEVQSMAIDAPEEAIAQLTAQAYPPTVAALLVQGFRNESGCFAFFLADLQKRTLTQMIALQSVDGAVSMTLEDADEGLWRVEYLPGGITEKTLRLLYPRKGVEYEVQ